MSLFDDFLESTEPHNATTSVNGESNKNEQSDNVISPKSIKVNEKKRGGRKGLINH